MSGILRERLIALIEPLVVELGCELVDLELSAGLVRIYVDRAGECTLYAATDKLPEAKDLVLKAKRELGIARGTLALSQARLEK